MTINQIFDKAHELMVELNIHELPVNPFAVADQLNIPIVSYKEASETGYAELVENVLRGKAEADAFCSRIKGQYIIFYDEKRTPPNRINFTIAHELGHIRLGHFRQDGYYTRYQLNKEGDPKEREADSFAGELLRPPVLLALAGITRNSDIRLCCNVTTSAANAARKAIVRIIDFLYIGRIALTTAFFEKQFSEFLHTYYCRSCNAIFYHHTDDFHCPICGSMNIAHKFVLNEGGLKSIMHYPCQPTFPGTNTISTCLRCGNDEINPNDNFCPICGAPLANKCYGRRKYDNSYEEEYWDENESCGRSLPANARFCPDCGCESLFFKEEMLESWHVESQKLKTTIDEELPF